MPEKADGTTRGSRASAPTIFFPEKKDMPQNHQQIGKAFSCTP